MPVAVLFATVVALPWLWPFTAGPMSAVVPYLASVALAAVTLALVGRRTNLPWWAAICTGWLAAAAISSVIAVLQYFDAETPFFPWMNIAAPGQAFGNLRQPNQLATLLVVGLLALRWLYLDGRLKAGLAMLLAALLATGLAATASRIGLVELLVMGAAVGWWAWGAGRGRWAVGVVGATLACYVVAALALPALLELAEGVAGRNMVDRLQHAESTCGSRLILWRNVLHLIGLKPWTGWGWDGLAYAHYITLYDGPRFCHILDNAHNLPLHLAVELGVPVAVLACGVLAWAVWRGRPWAETDPTRQLGWGVLLAIGLHSLVEYPLWYGPFQIAVAFGLWMILGSSARQPDAGSYDIESDSARGRSAWRLGIATLMLAAVAYAGWDYHRISQVFLPADERAAAYRDGTMAHARRSWLFADTVRFAEVTTRPVTRANADWMLPAALQTLHFSPEPRVITKVIESATRLNEDALALAHLARFRAAFPREHRAWVEDNQRVLQGAREQLQAASAAP